MVRKTLGYVELEWTCPQCGTRNPGPQKSCSSCGSPQPKKVGLQQAPHEELITDEAEIARAKAGPDVHCAFCGARNPAGTQRCTQCGADLSTARARESGRVLGAYRSGPAEKTECPRCGALNDADAHKCAQCNASLPRPRLPEDRPQPSRGRPKTPSRKLSTVKIPGGKLGIAGVIGIAFLALLACVACVLITRCVPAQEMTGQVQAVEWTRSIEIEELRDVTKEDWRNEIPSSAGLGRCTRKHHHTQDDPAPNAAEVCGTPYTVDTGTGHGQVVQDCEYRVYADWCQYTVEEWKEVDESTLSGHDLNPRWPNPSLGPKQREGKRRETYSVVFDTEERTYTYRTSNVDRFVRCEIGSRWILQVNAFNAVTSIEPAR